MIYHFATEAEWAACKNKQEYAPEKFAQEGFIHCSTKTQLERTANRLFKSHPKILLLFIDDESEKDFIRYENMEGGDELYPHIYRKIPTDSIVKIVSLTKASNSSFDFPDLD